MRDYTGIPVSIIAEPNTRRALHAIDYFLRDLSRGVQRIEQGQVPSGSGNTIPVGEGGTLDDYLYLPGRVGGQVVKSVDENATVTIEGADADLSTEGAIGHPILRLRSGSTNLLDFRAYAFDVPGTIEVALTNSAGVGIGVNFPSDDGTSAFRIASTTNRTFLQCGLKNSGGNVDNDSMTLGAAGGRVADSLATEFQRIIFANSGLVAGDGSAVAALTTRVGINVLLDQYLSSSAANKAKSLHVGDHPSAAATDPAPVVIESATAGRHAIQVRSQSTGSSPNVVLGSTEIVLARSLTGDSNNDNNGRLLLFCNDAVRASITSDATGGAANSRISFRDQADARTFVFERFSTWADSLATSVMMQPNRLMLLDSSGTALSRVGISATSVVLGPAVLATMPAPLSSRILTVVDSAGTVLSGFTSTGNHFHVSGAVNGYPWVSDGSGNGQWGLTAGVPQIKFNGEAIVGGSFFIAADLDAFDLGIYAQLDPAALTGVRSFALPDVSGTLVLTTAIQTLGNKTLGLTNGLRSDTASVGCRFEDNTTTTKRLRMVLSGAVGNNSITLTNTAARNYGLGDLGGNLVVVGDDAPAVAAGSLGKVDLTAQTAAIGSTNLSSTPPAGLYAVEVYAACTTASGSGAPTLDVTIAWTDVVGATTANAVTALSLAATGRASGRVLCQVASGNIAYTTTINAASGSPQYALYIRVVALG